MKQFIKLQEYFKKYKDNLHYWLPDGLISVDLFLLAKFNLLDSFFEEKDPTALTLYFHVAEFQEKMTLVNEHFVVWIIPQKLENTPPTTLTLVALNYPDFIQLELGFLSSGVYNTSRLVFKVLEKFIEEIQENEEFLKRLKKGKN